MKKILITGANGFIGSTLVDQALSLGWQVTAAIRKSSDLSLLKGLDIQFLELDYANCSSLEKIFKELPVFDFIIHNAGTTKAKDQEAYDKVNLNYTQNLIESLIAVNKVPAKFLFVSSLAAIGPTTCGKCIEDDTVPAPVSHYGKSKLKAENYIRSLNNFPWIIVRPTGVYGPRDKDIFIFIQMINKLLELYIGRKGQDLSFICSTDLAGLMLSILNKSAIHETYFGYDFNKYRSVDLGNAVKSALHKKTIQIKIPISIVSFMAIISEKIGQLKQKTPALNFDKVNELKAESWMCNSNKAAENLGWKPQFDLYSGMKYTVDWYKSNHWLK